MVLELTVEIVTIITFTFIVFLFNIVIIIGIGSIIFNLLGFFNNKLRKIPLRDKVLIDLTLGLSFLTFYSYLLITFNAFNIISIMLIPIMLFIIILILKGKKLINGFKKIHNFLILRKNELFKDIIIITSSLILLFILIIPKLMESSALFALDPYLWTKQAIYISIQGTINYSNRSFLYPWGFIFFTGSNFLLIPNFILRYYFIKFACIPYLIIYIIIFYIIIKKIIKKPFLLFISLILLISSTYFISRSLMFLSSSIPTLLILISIIFFINNDIPKYLMGFIFPTLYLFNPIYCFFFIILTLSFFFIKIVQNLKDRKMIIFLLKNFVYIFITSLIVLIPYIINSYTMYHVDLLSLIKKSINRFKIQNTFNLIFNLRYPELFLFQNLNQVSLKIIQISLYILPSILGFMWIIQEKRKKNLDLFLYLIIGVSIFIISNFILYNTLHSILNVYYIFERAFEIFTSFLVILVVFFFKLLFNKIKKIKSKILFSNYHQFNKIIKSKFLLILPIFLFTSVNYLYSISSVGVYYTYDDSITNCVFYLKSNINYDNNIAVQGDKNPHSPYDLLVDYNLSYIPMKHDLIFSDFLTFINNHQINYIILNLSVYNSGFIQSIQNDTSFVNLIGNSNINKFQLFNFTK